MGISRGNTLIAIQSLFLNSNMYALCSWFSGASVVVSSVHFQSWNRYLSFHQISVVDGFFFKAFSRLIENNLRKRKAIDRHVSLLFANLMLYLLFYTCIIFKSCCLLKGAVVS